MRLTTVFRFHPPAEKPTVQGTPPPIFELQGVGLHLGGTDILEGIEWTLRAGEHWAVLGPNGSGKTSLLRVACGYRWHTSGRLRRFGRELIDLAELRARIGWVSADLLTTVRQDDTAAQTVLSGRYGQVGLRFLPSAPVTEAGLADARSLLESIGAGSIADKPLRVLSQGERQQVLVARARMTEPWLLVLDEPCAGMDPGARERFLAWLGGMLAEPETPAVVMITHHLEEVLPAFDHALLMAEGRIASAGPPAEALTPESLGATYGVGVEQIERNAGRLWPIWSAGN